MKNEERFTGFKLRFRPKVQFAPETAQIGFPPCPPRRPPAVRGNAPMDAACPVRGSHARAVPLLSAVCPRLPAVASLLLHARQSCAMLSPHSPCRFLPRAAARAQRHGRHGRARTRRVPAAQPFLFPSRQCRHVPRLTPPLPRPFSSLHGRRIAVATGGPQPPPLHATGMCGQGTMARLPNIRGSLRVRVDPLVLPRPSAADGMASSGRSSVSPAILCSKFASGTSYSNLKKGRVLSAMS